MHSGAAVCFQVCAWTSRRASRVLAPFWVWGQRKDLPSLLLLLWWEVDRNLSDRGQTEETGWPLPGLALSGEGCVQVHTSSPAASGGQKGAWATVGTARPSASSPPLSCAPPTLTPPPPGNALYHFSCLYLRSFWFQLSRFNHITIVRKSAPSSSSAAPRNCRWFSTGVCETKPEPEENSFLLSLSDQL